MSRQMYLVIAHAGVTTWVSEAVARERQSERSTYKPALKRGKVTTADRRADPNLSFYSSSCCLLRRCRRRGGRRCRVVFDVFLLFVSSCRE
ncbi:unnamed protein product [Boreogadus saida]